VGYLLAGVSIGPYTPGLVADPDIALELAEIGVGLLMFAVGLHFSIADLLSVRRLAIPGAVGQIAVGVALGALVALAFGTSVDGAIVLGLAISVASTVVLLRTLRHRGELDTDAGRTAVGWLIVEDLFTVLVLVVLPTIPVVRDGGGFGDVALPVVEAIAKAGVLTAIMLVIGPRVLPGALAFVERIGSRELFTIAVLGIALGIAFAASIVFDVSLALGAFLAGAVLSESRLSDRAARDLLPMTDVFTVLFFVSVGMLLDPSALLTSPGLIAGALAVVLVGKPIVAMLLVWAMRYPLRTTLTVGVSLSQIGEFSFILATLGRELGILTLEATNTLVAASIVSIVMNPVAYRTIRPLERWATARPRLWARLNRSPPVPSDLRTTANPRTADPNHRAIIIGFGPTGRTVVRLLRDAGIAPTVVELNMDAVRALRQEGTDAIYGDATRPDTLEAAGVRKSGSLILGSAGMANSAEVIRMARTMNPDIRVLARASYLRDVAALKEAGATNVYSGEGEVALAFVEDIMDSLGATPEQIDRERARAHDELFGEVKRGGSRPGGRQVEDRILGARR
jgi:CPA2 family monovalent cation:H+ antiporter-2